MFVAQFVGPLPRRTARDPSDSRESDQNCDTFQIPAASHQNYSAMLEYVASSGSPEQELELFGAKLRYSLVRYFRLWVADP